MEKAEFVPAERPEQVKPTDNLRPEGEFYAPSKKPFGPAEKRTPIKHDDNLRPEGDFERPEKNKFKPAERPKQVKPIDNLRPEGKFYTPDKKPTEPTEKRAAERPKQIRPVDNLKITGEFEGKRKTQEVVTKVERTEVKKHIDQLKLNDGKMETTTTNSATFKLVKPVKKDTIDENTRQHRTKSTITLGDDTTILRTTNQMNSNTITTQKDRRTTLDKSTDDDNRIRDGTLAITTVRVTTVLENEKDHTPIREIIRTGGQTREHEEVHRTTSQTNVVNKQNIINKKNIVNEITSTQTHVNNRIDVNDVRNIRNRNTSSITDVLHDDRKVVQKSNVVHQTTGATRTVQTTDNGKTTRQVDGPGPRRPTGGPHDTVDRPDDIDRTGSTRQTIEERKTRHVATGHDKPTHHETDYDETNKTTRHVASYDERHPIGRARHTIEEQTTREVINGHGKTHPKGPNQPSVDDRTTRHTTRNQTIHDQTTHDQTHKTTRHVSSYDERHPIGRARKPLDEPTNRQVPEKKHPAGGPNQKIIEERITRHVTTDHDQTTDGQAHHTTRHVSSYDERHPIGRARKPLDEPTNRSTPDKKRPAGGPIQKIIEESTTRHITTDHDQTTDDRAHHTARHISSYDERHPIGRARTPLDEPTDRQVPEKKHPAGVSNQKIIEERTTRVTTIGHDQTTHDQAHHTTRHVSSYDERHPVGRARQTIEDRPTGQDKTRPAGSPSQRIVEDHTTRNVTTGHEQTHKTSRHVASYDERHPIGRARTTVERLHQTTGNDQTVDSSGANVRPSDSFVTRSSQHHQTSNIIDNANEKGHVTRSVSSQDYQNVDNTSKNGVTSMKSVKSHSEKISSHGVITTHGSQPGDTNGSRIVDRDSSSRSVNSKQNQSSDVLNVGQSQIDSTLNRNVTKSQSDKINTQLHLRQHESTISNTSMSTTRQTSQVSNHSSNISNALRESSTIVPSSSHHEPRRDYTASTPSSSSVDQGSSSTHHRKNVLTSSSDVTNAVFHRKANLSSNSNEALHSNSMSSTAAIQRKSISNLHDQAIYNTSADRKSYSSLHRQGKDVHSQSHHTTGGSTTTSSTTGANTSSTSITRGGDRAQKIVKQDNLHLGGEFYGKSESKSYGNFAVGHQHHAIDRTTVRRSNQSSFTIGDGNVSSSVYRREYAVVHNAPCPAAHIEKTTFKHTRDTKSHKFYKPTLQ